jgi:hypothetical protein
VRKEGRAWMREFMLHECLQSPRKSVSTLNVITTSGLLSEKIMTSIRKGEARKNFYVELKVGTSE